MSGLRAPGTIRSNLIKILIGALFPMVFLGAWQGMLAFQDSRNLVAQRLRANAWAIAERERDPFIIARHSLQMIAQLEPVQRFAPDCDEVMADARDGATGVLNFVRTDRTGVVRCSGLAYTPKQSLAANPWWQRARAANSFVLGGPLIGEVSGRPVVLLLLPIRSSQGDFAGTVSAGIGLDRLANSLAARQHERGGVVLLVDRLGNVLLAAGPARFTGLPGAAKGLAEPQTARATDGKHWTYVSAPMFEDELMVVYAEPRLSFTNAALSRIWLILALPLLAGALTLAGVWFGTQYYLLDWLPRLRNLTQRIAERGRGTDRGEFASAPAEIAGMAADLDAMARILDANSADLHKALDTQRALTRELNHRVRNNIQIIVSLLTMQGEKVTDGWVRTLIDQARARVSALGLVHRFMYDQDEDRLGHVMVAQLLGDLCAQIRTSNPAGPSVELQVMAGPRCELSFDSAVPMVLFVLEAVAGAMAAASAGTPLQLQGRIVVLLAGRGPHCRLEILDSVWPETPQQEDYELLEALALQLAGTFGADRVNGQKRIWLEFPAAQIAAA